MIWVSGSLFTFFIVLVIFALVRLSVQMKEKDTLLTSSTAFCVCRTNQARAGKKKKKRSAAVSIQALLTSCRLSHLYILVWWATAWRRAWLGGPCWCSCLSPPRRQAASSSRNESWLSTSLGHMPDLPRTSLWKKEKTTNVLLTSLSIQTKRRSSCLCSQWACILELSHLCGWPTAWTDLRPCPAPSRVGPHASRELRTSSCPVKYKEDNWVGGVAARSTSKQIKKYEHYFFSILLEAAIQTEHLIIVSCWIM